MMVTMMTMIRHGRRLVSLAVGLSLVLSSSSSSKNNNDQGGGGGGGGLVRALRYDSALSDFNLNQNITATDPLDYWGSRNESHTYHPSPTNWRFPFYTVFLDRFVNGDPNNDDINGTVFETDLTSTQLRFGGDLQGVVDTLDYIAGMGIKGLYIAGSPFINLPWRADSYSPVDLTLLDWHFGDIVKWQTTIDEIHRRGMYVILDNTMATMGDLIGFEGYLNTSTPFSTKEHKVQWKTDRRYTDFRIGNSYNETCQYPTFYFEDGYEVNATVKGMLKGCYDSDYDQFGDIEAFGVFPDWQRQLAKFASVQDRLREWLPSVRARLERFSCMTIASLDIDGFRIDKAMQVTVDAQAAFSTSMRECARRHNKTNFMVVGEITAGNTLGSIYIGRGRRPDMKPDTAAKAIRLKANDSESDPYSLRPFGQSGLDAGAFHYSIYRFMTRFLGLSGNLKAGYDLPTDWIETWNQMLLTNDFHNANTGQFDPRHLYGVTNQDLFRWPSIEQGTERQLLAYFITTLLLPGTPLVYYGEEQELYLLDNTATNYVYGRQPMSPSDAWRSHGCYQLSNDVYTYWPVTKARVGCMDPSQVLDRRDPSAPVRNIMKHMFMLRDRYPVLEHGWLLEKVSNKTYFKLLNGSTDATELGIWSVVRALYPGAQEPVEGEKPVWLVYHNENVTKTYDSDCAKADDAFVGVFDAGTVVRNLFNGSDLLTLDQSAISNANRSGSGKSAGCVRSITMQPFEFRAYVPQAEWKGPAPMLTGYSPGHDVSIDSTDKNGEVEVEFRFNVKMDCESIARNLHVASTIDGSNVLNSSTFGKYECGPLEVDDKRLPYVGYMASTWYWSATLKGLQDGIHKITLVNASSSDKQSTNSVDHFLLRFGRTNNPVIFPYSANYSRSLLKMEGDIMYVDHAAPGASKWRYSTNWGTTWSAWEDYATEKTKITTQKWAGTADQAWTGAHVICQYWSAPLGSASFVQHGDSNGGFARRFPHVRLHGPFNQWGFDAGLPGSMDLVGEGLWDLHFMYEWPASVQLNVWGINPDSQPDVSFIYGDIDGDGVVDRMPPGSLSANTWNLTDAPPWPALSYRLFFNDGTHEIVQLPQGNVWIQIFLFVLLAIVPVSLAFVAVFAYMRGFYRVMVNTRGFKSKVRAVMPLKLAGISNHFSDKSREVLQLRPMTPTGQTPVPGLVGVASASSSSPARKTVLMATMEYNIDDWNISIRIGGLGVMAKLASSALTHVDLIWVVPCVGGIEYPVDRPAPSMFVHVLNQTYEVLVQYHTVNNITYVILDAPLFRQQTKDEPYNARMDDAGSAILYSAWNSCIAETMRRFPIDIYHINDYHGAAAPLYLLPETVPCCLSLHNAEFQGMWPMRTPEESKEVCDLFGLPPDIVKEYVQYGTVFNLLHAAASYLRVHQRGFGAVGVSKKYGDRSLARYPIFWSLKAIGQLPNPDPSDTADWDPEKDALEQDPNNVTVDDEFEAKRGELRMQAQEWAGLEQDPSAELFVFVGRWSLQKGVDLIADIFPSILEKYPKVQLICIGPVIDLYGKFAALKLEKMMERYPKRVFSKPEFTQLPPYIFTGAEFALIPSRDEPFGLVAVEFGRKGALGVGARVGGLGQMPGFWYTVESMTPAHLLKQFRHSIESALACKTKKRAMMRAWSAKQRFPVAQWVKQIDELYNQCIRLHKKETNKHKRLTSRNITRPSSRDSEKGAETPGSAAGAVPSTPVGSQAPDLPAPTPPSNLSARPSDQSPGLEAPKFPWSGWQSARSSVASSIFSLTTKERHTSMMSVDSFACRAQNDGSANANVPPAGAPKQDGSAGTAPGTALSLPQPSFYAASSNRNSSILSLPDVMGDRTDMKLQHVDLNFVDANGEFYSEFEQKLEKSLTAKNSTTELCIESFIKKSEKDWFTRYRDAKLGRARDASKTRAAELRPGSRGDDGSRNASVVSRGRQRHRDWSRTPTELTYEVQNSSPMDDEFLLGDGYLAPTGLRKTLSIRWGDWPLYSILLAAGQVISINSYQIVLLTGETTQTPVKLYVVASTYLVSSMCYWFAVRKWKSVYSLSIPWLFYGLAFLIIGCSPFIRAWRVRSHLQLVATAVYAAGASSGALCFALNFGDEGGSPTKAWVIRALIVTGVQQVYSMMLWYWGSLEALGLFTPTGFFLGTPLPTAFVMCVPIAAMFFAWGALLYYGLPDYYRQQPESIPGLYLSLIHRKLVPWFFLMIIIQNYWLSAPYGRTWQFLFASQYIPGWGVALMAMCFFVLLWSIILYIFSCLSDQHTWLLPIFAIGLCAPRWAQMIWACSGMGWYLPWAGGGVSSAIVSRCLWLWLGLLDAIQGIGLGMMLLATLTRYHVMAVLIGAQIIGSVFTMLARATSPNALYANATFPDLTEGLAVGLLNKWFWICLIMQLIIPIGFFKFFRKEQVTKP